MKHWVRPYPLIKVSLYCDALLIYTRVGSLHVLRFKRPDDCIVALARLTASLGAGYIDSATGAEFRPNGSYVRGSFGGAK